MSYKQCVPRKCLFSFFTFLPSFFVASTWLAQKKPKIEITEPLLFKAQKPIKVACSARGALG